MEKSDNLKIKKNPPNTEKPEIVVKVRAVSRGIAVGKIVCLYGGKRQFYKVKIQPAQVEHEIRRFRAAVRLAKRQLKAIGVDKTAGGEIKSGIFAAHRLIVADKSLQTGIENLIREKMINAEWSVKEISDKYVARYKTIADAHLRERYIDVEDVAERLLTALGGGKSNLTLEKNAIIVAQELNPSTLIELAASQPQAIITENGGWTSHTFILAREMNIAAVTGFKRVLRRVENGVTAIVDGFNGQVILHPQTHTRRKYQTAVEKSAQEKRENLNFSAGKIKTLDGREIIIRANLDAPNGYAAAKRFGVKGIGLYRSEFLFNQFKGFPTEAEQIEAYRKISAMVGDETVKIRTFDIGSDQLNGENRETEKNPALGLRAIRLSLSEKKQFRTQLRAILQAALNDNIEIILPMIGDVAEIRQAKKILEGEKAKLKRKKIRFGKVRVGAMIEVPAAVLMIEEILAEVECACLGTNDLVQYLLAVDRDNEAVADNFRTLHPAVLRAVKKIFQAADKLEKSVVVCGEMAGSPFYAPILIGLGATELSMNVNSATRIRRVVENIAYEEAQAIAAHLEKCATADETEEFVRAAYLEKWSHLFSAESLPVRRQR